MTRARFRVIARERELQILGDALTSREPELIALWGRRRVGKTFLVRYGRSVPNHYFEMVGTKGGRLREQLENFSVALADAFHGGIPLKPPTSWADAFTGLRGAIDRLAGRKPVTLFFDEAPWLDGRRSGFLNALEHFWNAWASTQPRVKLIVCGSSSSWILKKIVAGRGGWHRRVTKRIHLRPFTLAESKLYLASRGIHYSIRDLIELYMALGGTAAYLKEVRRGESVSSCIGRLCLAQNAPLADEYRELFHSLFRSGSHHMKVVETLAARSNGLTRSELRARTKLSGRQFTEILDNLTHADFVDAYTPFGRSAMKHVRYRLTDFFVLFHLRWMNRRGRRLQWEAAIGSHAYRLWAGYSFETLVWNHVHGLLATIGLQNAPVHVCKWRHQATDPNEESAEIDLLLEVEKGALYIVEVKHLVKVFELTRAERDRLSRRKRVLMQHLRPERTVFIHLLSSSGVKQNAHSREVVDFIYPVECLLVGP